MINSKRVSKLKKEVYKKIGNPIYPKFVVKIKEGIFFLDSNIKAYTISININLLKNP